jgi:CRP-like cAMP-binding protein
MRLNFFRRGLIVGEIALLDKERPSATLHRRTAFEVHTLSLDGLSRMSYDAPLIAYKFMFSLTKI